MTKFTLLKIVSTKVAKVILLFTFPNSASHVSFYIVCMNSFPCELGTLFTNSFFFFCRRRRSELPYESSATLPILSFIIASRPSRHWLCDRFVGLAPTHHHQGIGATIKPLCFLARIASPPHSSYTSIMTGYIRISNRLSPKYNFRFRKKYYITKAARHGIEPLELL